MHIRSDRGRAEAAAVVEANMAQSVLVRVTQGLSCMSVPGIDLPDSCREMWCREYTAVHCDEVEEVERAAGLIYNLVSGFHSLQIGRGNGSDEVA